VPVYFSPELFHPLVDWLLERDPFLVLADFEDYARCHSAARDTYRDRAIWTRKAILNVARMGKFSSDRTILGYNSEIWRALQVPVPRGEDR